MCAQVLLALPGPRRNWGAVISDKQLLRGIAPADTSSDMCWGASESLPSGPAGGAAGRQAAWGRGADAGPAPPDPRPRPALTFTGAAVGGEPEAHGAAAVVGAGRVLALVAAQAARVPPTLVDV